MAYTRPNGTDRFQILSSNKQGLPSLEVDDEYNGLTDYVNGLSIIQSTATEWVQDLGSPIYTSPTTFTLDGDQTLVYMTGRKVKFSLTGPEVYSTVTGSTYSGGTLTTTITIDDSVLTANLDIVYYGILSAGANSSMPTDQIPDDAVNYIHRDGSVAMQNAQVIPGELTTLAEVNIAQVNGADSVEIGDETVPLELKGTALTFDTGTGPSALIIVGEIRMWPVETFTPSGWLLCQGQEISRTTYDALYAVLGDVWGDGDGLTTFNLPDFRGRSPLGTGTGTAADATLHTLADTEGTEGHQLVIGEIPSTGFVTDNPGSHTHDTTFGFGSAGATGSTLKSDGSSTAAKTSDANGAHTHSISGGLDEAHNNLHPFAALYFMIKT